MALPSIANLEACNDELLATCDELTRAEIEAHLKLLEEKYQSLKLAEGKEKIAALIASWQDHLKQPEKLILLAKGGPSFVNLRVKVPQLRLVINGPGMLFESFKLISSLSSEMGFNLKNLAALADSFRVSVLCAHGGRQNIEAKVESDRTGGYLSLSCGPMSMYQSEMLLSSKSGESFEELLERHLFARLDEADKQVAVVGFSLVGESHHHGGMEMVWIASEELQPERHHLSHHESQQEAVGEPHGHS